jgi:hypothetical protein
VGVPTHVVYQCDHLASLGGVTGAHLEPAHVPVGGVYFRAIFKTVGKDHNPALVAYVLCQVYAPVSHSPNRVASCRREIYLTVGAQPEPILAGMIQLTKRNPIPRSIVKTLWLVTQAGILHAKAGIDV